MLAVEVEVEVMVEPQGRMEELRLAVMAATTLQEQEVLPEVLVQVLQGRTAGVAQVLGLQVMVVPVVPVLFGTQLTAQVAVREAAQRIRAMVLAVAFMVQVALAE